MTADKRKYILLQNDLTLSYDESNCYVNGKIVEQDGAQVPPQDLCLNKQRSFYDNFLKRHFKNLVILTAAGTSLDNGDETSSGKTREGLWTYCQAQIDAFKKYIPDFESKAFFTLKNIEGLLSHVILYEKLNGEITESGKSLRQILESKIADACRLTLHAHAPHLDFLNKITARKPSDPRVQLFTCNYDLLFETAANQGGFVLIDGFSYTQPRKFSGRYFDLDIVNREKTRIKQEESFISKVFQFHKLHGSLNWFRDEHGDVLQKDNPTAPLIIYPAVEKYESSYEQPYFEMMSRFQQALRKDNTLLVVIGFGFQDKHIQNAIIEAVDQNPSFQLLIVYYTGDENGGIDSECLRPFFSNVSENKVKRNVNIVYDSFASFTKKFPSNSTYIESVKEGGNESV